MNRIDETFGASHVLLPVIHPAGWEEALASVRVVQDAGVKGVFLIDQGMDSADVFRLVVAVRAAYPALWIGINLLGRSPSDALEEALAGCDGHIDGIWTDNAGIDEAVVDQPRAAAFVETRHKLGWNGLYFGGVAFKYQREVAPEHLSRAAAIAADYMDVVCTSGPGTGKAADLAKVKAMRSGLGDGALALASGVTDENVTAYLPLVNAFLVGTSIEDRFGVVSADKVSRLVRAMRGS